MTISWVDASSPWVDARQSDGSRVHAILLTCSITLAEPSDEWGVAVAHAHALPTGKDTYGKTRRLI
jgi:hypothetical protein